MIRPVELIPSETKNTFYYPEDIEEELIEGINDAGAEFVFWSASSAWAQDGQPSEEALYWKARFEDDGHAEVPLSSYGKVELAYALEPIYQYCTQYFGDNIDPDSKDARIDESAGESLDEDDFDFDDFDFGDFDLDEIAFDMKGIKPLQLVCTETVNELYFPREFELLPATLLSHRVEFKRTFCEELWRDREPDDAVLRWKARFEGDGYPKRSYFTYSRIELAYDTDKLYEYLTQYFGDNMHGGYLANAIDFERDNYKKYLNDKYGRKEPLLLYQGEYHETEIAIARPEIEPMPRHMFETIGLVESDDLNEIYVPADLRGIAVAAFSNAAVYVEHFTCAETWPGEEPEPNDGVLEWKRRFEADGHEEFPFTRYFRMQVPYEPEPIYAYLAQYFGRGAEALARDWNRRSNRRDAVMKKRTIRKINERARLLNMRMIRLITRGWVFEYDPVWRRSLPPKRRYK